MIKLIKEDNGARKTYTDIYRRYLGKDDEKAFDYTVEDMEKQLESIKYKCEQCISHLSKIKASGMIEFDVDDEDDPFPLTVSTLIDANDYLIYTLDELNSAEHILDYCCSWWGCEL